MPLWQMQIPRRGRRHSFVLFPMAQATIPGGPRLPCSPKQALTLYQLLFQRPAGLGQLQTALQQVPEGRDCPPGLELPMMLLKMEQSQRTKEKLFWDLELLTGVGLSLFWPPWARFYGQRDWARHAWSQCSQPWSRNPDGTPEQLSSEQHPPPQADEAPSESRQLLKGGPAAVSSSTSDLPARRDADQRLEGPVVLPEAAPGISAEGQEAKGAGCSAPSSSSDFEEPGNSEPKNPDKMEERNQAEPSVQSFCRQPLRSQQEGKQGQEAPESPDLASQGLPAPQYPFKGLGSGQSQERAEPQTPLIGSPQGHPKETPPGQRGQSPQAYKGESLQGQDKGSQSQRERKQAQQGPQFGEGSNSEVWDEAQGEATIWHQEEGDLQGYSRDFCKSPGKPIPQHVEKEIPGLWGGSTQEGAWAALPGSMPPGGEGLASRAQKLQARLLGACWEQSRPRDSEPPKAAWPALRSREEAPAEQKVLQRLLELHGAARRRWRRDREQQRLRVLDRLRVVANLRRRVHPLHPRAAQLAPQEDSAGQRRILRELLEQVRQGRTQRLRALGAKNTHNFQELLSPSTEEPTPGE